MKRLVTVLILMAVALFCVQAVSAQNAIQTVLHAMNWISFTEENNLYQTWSRAFEKAHPGVLVQFEGLPQGYDEKIAASFAAGTAPDMYFIHTVNLPAQVEQGMPQALDSFINGPKGINAKDIFPAVWSASTYKGERYGWSQVNGCQILYYNKKAFDQAKIPYPTDKWTWDDLAAAAKKLTKKDDKGRVTQYGFQCDELNRMFTSILWSNGGSFFDNDDQPTEVKFNGPEGVKAAVYLKNLVQTLGAAPPPGTPGALGYREAFRTGNAAMILDGSWMILTYAKQKDLSWGTQVIPKGTAGRKGWYDDVIWAMSSQTKSADMTWELIKYFSGKDTALQRADYGGDALSGMPSWISAYKDPRWKPTARVKPVEAMMAQSRPEMAFWNAGMFHWSLLLTALQEIVSTDVDPQARLNTLAEETQGQILSKMP
jgi:multiple sugar transport system substrate-binding protein